MFSLHAVPAVDPNLENIEVVEAFVGPFKVVEFICVLKMDIIIIHFIALWPKIVTQKTEMVAASPLATLSPSTTLHKV